MRYMLPFWSLGEVDFQEVKQAGAHDAQLYGHMPLLASADSGISAVSDTLFCTSLLHQGRDTEWIAGLLEYGKHATPFSE